MRKTLIDEPSGSVGEGWIVHIVQVEEVSDREDDSVSGEAAPSSDSGLGSQDRHVDESDVIAMGSVDYESASRLEFDRSQRSRVNLSSTLNPHQADQNFMTGLLPLLRKVDYFPVCPRKLTTLILFAHHTMHLPC